MGLANVLIVEDDSFAATTLGSALLLSGFSIVATASNAKQALGAIHSMSVDTAVLDIDLGPGPTGIDVAHALREKSPRLGLVFLTSFSDPRLSKSGSVPLPKGSRYLTKGSLRDLKTLGSLILQAKYQPLQVTGEQVQKPKISASQIEVLKLVASGATNTQISLQLGISEKAVEHLITRTAKALGISRVAEKNLRVQMVRAYSELAGKALPTS